MFESALSRLGKEGNELDNSGEIKYAKKGYKRRDVNEITEKEYYHHAWASANNLLSKEEFGVLDSAVGKISKGDYYLKNADGFYMIPVGENGVLNKIVLTDGEYNNYSIDTIIEIALNNETELSIERENIYASESKGIQTETNELLKVHYSKDYRFSDFKRNVDNGLRDSNGEQDGARSDRAIKFSHKDSQGRNLNKAQQDFFKDSKVVDENGNLRVVYHGTVGEFYTFDKTYLGSATGVGDAKLGFFFTSSENVALEYAINAHDTKFFNLAHKIANGDNDKLKKLLSTDGYKEFAMTKDVEELGILKEKGENFEHDVYEVYLNIKNPLVDDWHGMTYRKAKMLKLVTRAIQENYDGVIIKNIDDSYDHDGQISDVYVIFEPNQIKLTTNKAPTENNDIRFSHKTNAYEFVKNKSSENRSFNKDDTTQNKHMLNQNSFESVDDTNSDNNVNVLVNLSDNNELTNRIKQQSNKSKYTVIKEYLVEKFAGETFILSDGISAIMDNSDAQHLAHLSDNKKTATLSTLREVIEKAKYSHTANNVKHNKFNSFRYYEIRVSFNNEEYDILLNVGHSKFEDKYHIYDITKKRRIANESSTRLARSEDYALKNNSSTNSILNTEEKVNNNLKNSLDTNKYSKKSRTLTDGQVKKKIANYTNLKVYSKTETEKIINTIIEGNLGTDSVVIDVSGKTKNQAIDMLWNELNTAPKGKQLSSAFKLADYIIENRKVNTFFKKT